MESLDNGVVDFRYWMAQLLKSYLTSLCSGDARTLERVVCHVPECRKQPATRKIIAEVRDGQGCPSIDRLSLRPLRDILRVLTGFQDLTLALIGIDQHLPQTFCLGDIREIRRAIADRAENHRVTAGQLPTLEVLRRMPLRTEQRLECTIIAVDELFQRVEIRKDVAFVAVWRVGTDFPAHMSHSMDVPDTAARQYLMDFGACALSKAKTIDPSR